MRTKELEKKVIIELMTLFYYLTKMADTVGGGDEMILKIQIPVLGDNNLFGFELVDTPGADEAGCSSIAGEINRVISDSSVILYLLNYTSFGKQADIDFINLVSKIQASISFVY